MLARPLLHGSEHAVELSNGKQVDAGALMRKVLQELGRRYAKAMDFSGEYGTAGALDDAERRRRECPPLGRGTGGELVAFGIGRTSVGTVCWHSTTGHCGADDLGAIAVR